MHPSGFDEVNPRQQIDRHLPQHDPRFQRGAWSVGFDKPSDRRYQRAAPRLVIPTSTKTDKQIVEVQRR
jgi:hypothetical protein